MLSEKEINSEIFIDEIYETMLVEEIPAIRNLFSNDFDRVWFQQDEAQLILD